MISINFSFDGNDYEKMTKAELLKIITSLEEYIGSLEDEKEQLYYENIQFRRSISDYEAKEENERIYKMFPHMKPPWENDW